MDQPWIKVIVGLTLAVLVTWLLLVAARLAVKPKGNRLAESMRLLPDLLRLLRRVAADPTLPKGVRLRLGLLLLYLAMPFDLVPDFIPVLGYADDAIIATWTLRSVARRIGVDQLRRHRPGSDDGFAALCHLTGIR